ncbi:MAG: alpha-L-fucosidase [Oligosphaeraceae bacterium]
MDSIRYSLFFDFHTMITTPEVGKHFDGEEFVRQISQCGVDYLTLHACCNQGNAYYPTKVGKPHPALTQDVFGSLARACHKQGIALSAYFNIHYSDQVLREHPEWQEISATPGKYTQEDLYYRRACYNSGYGEYVLAMAKEVLAWYDVDGFFFDCLAASDCVCPVCRKKMEAQGVDPGDKEAVLRFNHASGHALARMLHDQLAPLKPGLRFFFNGRPFEEMEDYDTHLEAECLPTAPWGNGYEQLPLMAHYMRPLARKSGKPILNMTGRFIDWGQFGSLRTRESLEYDLYYGVANGLRPNVADHLPPDGRWPLPVFRLVQSLYRELQWYDPWTLGAENRPEVAVVFPRRTPLCNYPSDAPLKGATRMLTELKVQFDIVTEAVSWESYRLLIFPDQVSFTPEILRRVEAHLARGGRILATGQSGLDPEGKAFAMRKEWPALYQGPSPFLPLYFQPEGPFCQGLPEMPLQWFGDGFQVAATEGATPLLFCVRPVCHKGWDGVRVNYYTPPAEKTDIPLLLRKGGILYLAANLFQSYAKVAMRDTRLLLENLLKELDPAPQLYTRHLPSFARAFLQSKENLRMVHLMTYCPEKRLGTIEVDDRPVVLNGEIALRLDNIPVTRVRCLAAGKIQELPFQEEQGYCKVTVPQVEGYALLLFETEPTPEQG